MKVFIVLAAVVAAASAQFGGFGQQFGGFSGVRPNFGRFNPQPVPQRFVQPTAPPQYTAFSSTPTPISPAPANYRPSVAVTRSNSDQAANIVRYDSDAAPDGSFNYVVETDNGIAAQAQGTPRVFSGNPPVAPVVIQGSYSYTSPEGQPISISYIADENGFQASGDAIPTPPPVPEAILRSLEYNARLGQK